ARAWSSPHGTDGLLAVPDEALMITGDGNLLELQGTVRYTISDPRTYLFEVTDAPALLRSAAESVLRETVAGHTFADLLTGGRGRAGRARTGGQKSANGACRPGRGGREGPVRPGPAR